MANLPPSVSDPYTYFYSTIINSPLPSYLPQLTPLDTTLSNELNINDVLKECKYIKYNYGFKETQCPISLEDFKDGDSLIELPCKHIFLENNLKEWIKEKQTCPVCRYILVNINNGNSDGELVRRQSNITTQIDTMITYLSNQLSEADNVDTLDSVFEIY
jgi:hypothetical protein